MSGELKKLIRQFFKYSIAGGIAALIEWLTFFTANRILDLHYMTAVIISFILATLANYIISIKFVFEPSQYKSSLQILLVFGVSLIGLLMNLVFMSIFVSYLEFDSVFSKVVSTGLVFLWNFISRKIWIFKS